MNYIAKIPVALAAASVPVSSAIGAEHPWVRARNLARQLSDVLAEIERHPIAGGRVVASIRAAGEPLAVSFVDQDFWDETNDDFSGAANMDGTAAERLDALLSAFRTAAATIDPRIDRFWLCRDMIDYPGEPMGVTFSRSPTKADRKSAALAP